MNSVLRIRHRFAGAALIISALFCGDPASGEDGRSVLLKAFERTKSASSVESCTEIINRCNSVNASSLSTKMVNYRSKLLGWAYNRRGELYSLQAATAEVDPDGASDLDTRAFNDFIAAIESDPGHWKPRHNRGVSHALRGNHQLAIADFTAALELRPEEFDTRYNRAAIMAEMGRTEESLEDFDFLVHAQPNDPEALAGRAAVYAQLGELSLALADCNAAVKASPRWSPAYTQRGRICEQLGKWGEAAANFRQAVELDRDSGEAYLAAAWLMSTCPEAHFRNPSLAVEAADRAITLVKGPNRWRALDVAAAAYAAIGHFEQARQFAQQAFEQSPAREMPAVKSRLASYRENRPYRQSGAVTLRGQLKVSSP